MADGWLEDPAVDQDVDDMLASRYRLAAESAAAADAPLSLKMFSQWQQHQASSSSSSSQLPRLLLDGGGDGAGSGVGGVVGGGGLEGRVYGGVGDGDDDPEAAWIEEEEVFDRQVFGEQQQDGAEEVEDKKISGGVVVRPFGIGRGHDLVAEEVQSDHEHVTDSEQQNAGEALTWLHQLQQLEITQQQLQHQQQQRQMALTPRSMLRRMEQAVELEETDVVPPLNSCPSAKQAAGHAASTTSNASSASSMSTTSASTASAAASAAASTAARTSSSSLQVPPARKPASQSPSEQQEPGAEDRRTRKVSTSSSQGDTPLPPHPFAQPQPRMARSASETDSQADLSDGSMSDVPQLSENLIDTLAGIGIVTGMTQADRRRRLLRQLSSESTAGSKSVSMDSSPSPSPTFQTDLRFIAEENLPVFQDVKLGVVEELEEATHEDPGHAEQAHLDSQEPDRLVIITSGTASRRRSSDPLSVASRRSTLKSTEQKTPSNNSAAAEDITAAAFAAGGDDNDLVSDLRSALSAGDGVGADLGADAAVAGMHDVPATVPQVELTEDWIAVGGPAGAAQTEAEDAEAEEEEEEEEEDEEVEDGEEEEEDEGNAAEEEEEVEEEGQSAAEALPSLDELDETSLRALCEEQRSMLDSQTKELVLTMEVLHQSETEFRAMTGQVNALTYKLQTAMDRIRVLEEELARERAANARMVVMEAALKVNHATDLAVMQACARMREQQQQHLHHQQSPQQQQQQQQHLHFQFPQQQSPQQPPPQRFGNTHAPPSAHTPSHTPTHTPTHTPLQSPARPSTHSVASPAVPPSPSTTVEADLAALLANRRTPRRSSRTDTSA